MYKMIWHCNVVLILALVTNVGSKMVGKWAELLIENLNLKRLISEQKL
jgi:hypothetical protein